MNSKLGAWLQGQFLLSLSIGLLTCTTLTLLQMPFALPLAVLAGLFEIVPTVGPILSAVPAIVVALTISPNMAKKAIVSAQQVQTDPKPPSEILPGIMQRAVGLNPVIVIIWVIVGDRLLGIPNRLLLFHFPLFLIYKSLHEFLVLQILVKGLDKKLSTLHTVHPLSLSLALKHFSTIMHELWKQILAELQIELSQPRFVAFFKSTQLISLDNGVATIGTPNTMQQPLRRTITHLSKMF